jgi:hypothetical protein
MSHDSHTSSDRNDNIWLVDIGGGYVQSMDRARARDHYLELLKDYVSPYPDPVVRVHDGVRVVRDDLIVGTKARAADPVVARSNHENFVYVQPRTGLAGVALTEVTKNRGRECTLFMPACKEISRHQACCIERGAIPRFERIAAMPNLNKYAREWAVEGGHEFVPLGLRHPLATAGIIRAAVTIPEPELVYVAMSTGVLCRALQIAWPKARFIGVAVARNLKEGERGDCELISEPLSFQTPIPEGEMPPFPSVATYDAKAWRYVPKNTDRDILFWNVGTDPILNDSTITMRINSNVPWRKKSSDGPSSLASYLT